MSVDRDKATPQELLPSVFPKGKDNIRDEHQPLSPEEGLFPYPERHVSGDDTSNLDFARDHQGEDLTEEDTTADYIETVDEHLLPPANFNPFFTLIEDAVNGEHYHPSVHYVFADDDPEVQTAISINALTGYDPVEDSATDHPSTNDRDSTSARQPPAGSKERYLVVDVAADGHTVIQTQSLDKEWQIIQAGIDIAPTWDESEGQAGEAGLMLRIQGTELQSTYNSGRELLQDARENNGGDMIAGLSDIVMKFSKGMEVLGEVTGGEVDADAYR
ncbi:hypothetical protein M501DRAFT_23822 [Patellaria atrata CBS 101060]|uniref:Uncharacterized protein n=1 Tax=Patellaria atrata CBS 101060 TaxID=1346257 RepID=A0A9P4SJ51_9PEZI|nr:hypothetical protein M501DRAFT_23822 [Patellaria atrata CBS 101060]